MFQRVIDERLQLTFGSNGSGRIIRTAKVNEIDLAVGQGRKKAVFFRARHVDQAFVTRISCFAGSTINNITVHVNRVGGILNGDHTVLGKDALNICRIRLRSVTDKKLIERKINTQFAILACKSFPESLDSFGRAITSVGFRRAK